MIGVHVYFEDESEVPTDDEWKTTVAYKIKDYLLEHWDECVEEKRYIGPEGYLTYRTWIEL